jgi:hypothetical protein
MDPDINPPPRNTNILTVLSPRKKKDVHGDIGQTNGSIQSER